MPFTIAKYWEKNFKNTVPNIKGAHLNEQGSRSVVKSSNGDQCALKPGGQASWRGGVNEGHLE